MLILSRRRDERILLSSNCELLLEAADALADAPDLAERLRAAAGSDTVIQVIEVDHWRARFGITAPDGVIVWREELARQIESDGGDYRRHGVSGR